MIGGKGQRNTAHVVGLFFSSTSSNYPKIGDFHAW